MIPADTASAYAVKQWKTDVINVELQDERRMHSRAQERFWWGVMIPAVLELWRQEKEWTVLPEKGVVHGAFVRAVFGVVETPLGPERRSSTGLTLEEYSQLIEAAREHALTKYGVVLPDAEG